MTTPEQAILLETATYRFICENEGSFILAIKPNRAIVQLTGLSREQVNWHRTMILWTLGLWLPVYVAVALIKRPELVELRISSAGTFVSQTTVSGIEIRYI